MNDLLPCPFCDLLNTVREKMRRARSLGPGRYHYFVSCGSCNFEGPQGLTVQQGRDRWNRRAKRANAEGMVTGALCLMGDLETTDGKFPMALLITFSDAPTLRRAINDGVCRYDFGSPPPPGAEPAKKEGQ